MEYPAVTMGCLNLLASVLLLTAFIACMFDRIYNANIEHHFAADWAVNMPFVSACSFFFVGSWISLYMWKEQVWEQIMPHTAYVLQTDISTTCRCLV